MPHAGTFSDMQATGAEPAQASASRNSETKASSSNAAAAEPAKPAGGSNLPPRVIVELPDGTQFLGEDEAQLADEREQYDRDVSAAQGDAAQPGTERWLELRRLVYVSSLEGLMLARQRQTAVITCAPPRPHWHVCICCVVTASRFDVRYNSHRDAWHLLCNQYLFC